MPSQQFLLIGDAEPLTVGSNDYAKAIDRLGAKSPRFRERIAKGDLDSAIIYKVKTSELEYLDRSKGKGPAQKIVAGNK